MDFSRAECFETTAMGKSTSARRLQSLGIIRFVLDYEPHIDVSSPALTHEYGDQIKSTISEGVKNYFVLKYL
jgi:hypothetical protein